MTDSLSLEQRARQEPAIELKNVWFSYINSNYALKDIELSIERGSITILVGPNGSGKTTLLKVMNGLLRPQRGETKIMGRGLLDNADLRLTRRGIGYVPQQLGLVRGLTVLENILTGALNRTGLLSSLLGLFSEDDSRLADHCLMLVGLSHKKNEKVFRLSGGERQRVAIARALMQKPSIVLADELTSELDYASVHEIMNLLRELKKEGSTIVAATHNVEVAADYGDKVVFIRDGVKIAESNGEEVNTEKIRRIFSNGYEKMESAHL